MDMDLTNTALVDKRFARDIWWMMLMRGIFLVLFGLMAIIWPGITVYVLALLFSIYLLVVGVVNIVEGVRSVVNQKGWFLRILLGVFELGIGVYLLANGALVAVATFVIFLGLVFFMEGIVDIIGAFANHEDGGHRFLGVIVGFLAVLAGIILIRYPISSGVTFAWVLGLYALISGPLVIAMALSFRSTYVKSDGKAVAASASTAKPKAKTTKRSSTKKKK